MTQQAVNKLALIDRLPASPVLATKRNTTTALALVLGQYQ